VKRRNLLFLVLVGIIVSSLSILLASAMLFPHSDTYKQHDLDYATNYPDGAPVANEHAPCDGGYNRRYNPIPQFGPSGH
jgi:hypothetical protein